jgi:hypothetical protein
MHTLFCLRPCVNSLAEISTVHISPDRPYPAGCRACLRQHKKCDEARPRCGRCTRLSIECDYQKDLRWFNGTSLPRAPRIRRRPGLQAISTSLEDPEPGQDQSGSGDVAVQLDDTGKGLRTSYMDMSEPMNASLVTTLALIQTSPELLPPIDGSKILDILSGSSGDYYECASILPQSPVRQSSSTSDAEDGEAAEQVFPGSPSSTWMFGGLFDGDIGSILFQDTGKHIAYQYCKFDLLFCVPSNINHSREAKVVAVVRSVASILPAASRNPNGYQLVATFALSSPMMLDTIISVATVYMHMRGIVPNTLALRRQSEALASLSRNVETLRQSATTGTNADIACLRREVFAAILMQITVEIANGGYAIESHISNATNIFRQLGYERARPTTALGCVLVQRMTYIDILSSIFWHRRPLIPLSSWLYQDREEVQPDPSAPSFQETTGLPFALVRIFAHISHMTADLDSGVPLSLLIPRAFEIEAELSCIMRQAIDLGQDETDSSDDLLQLKVVGQCFHWAAIIILQHRVFNDPCNSPRVQFGLDMLLNLMEALPIGCGPDTQLSLPLYVAALVAFRQEHRERIKDKSSLLSRQYPLESRNQLTASFDTIWKAMDAQSAPRRFQSQEVPNQGNQGTDCIPKPSWFIC